MPKIIIDASTKGLNLNLKELYAYKDLLFTLAYRDLRVRYAQTVLGFLWAGLQPLATLVIFTLVFGRVAKVDTGSIPYPLFALAGMSAWTYFAFVMNQAGTSVIGARGMITKIYFPRLIIPLSKSIVGLVDFFVTFSFLLILMTYYGIWPTVNVVFFPFFLFLSLLSGLTVGIWLSALTVRFRDFQHIVSYISQLGIYLTPIAYPASLVPDHLRVLFFLNPMAGVIEGFRWSLIGTEAPDPLMFLSAGLMVVLFITGLYYFRKTEKTMADIV
ncbi:MAG: ABC transporter permease [Bacteroidetes bacterium]|nr:ABC transporter permease [Bacteroidota bacterium]